MSFPFIPTLIFILLSCFGFYTTWVLLYTNGTSTHLSALRADDGTRYLPGTDAPVRSTYTGFPIVDEQLTVLVMFFWSVVDGSKPEASLFGYHFAGQAFVGWSLLMIESLRGSKGRWAPVVLIGWGLAVQTLAYAVVMPWFFIVHLASSPALTSLDPSDYLPATADIASVVPAMLCGFVLPTILMSLPAPSILSYDHKQMLVAIWQFFPLWVGILQMFFASFIRSSQTKGAKETRAQKKSMKYMRMLYAFLILCGARDQLSATHFVALAHLFPNIFAPEYKGVWNIWNVFAQKSITPAVKMDSVGSGALLLLQYDENVGNVALIVWASIMFNRTRSMTAQNEHWLVITVAGIVLAAFTGAMGLATALVWARDEMVFANAGDKEDETRKLQKQ